MVTILKRGLIVLTIIVCCLMWRYMFYPPIKNDYLEHPTMEKNDKIKYILYWTPMFDRLDFYLGLGQQKFENCLYKNCYTTQYKNYIPIEEFDAIIFHGYEYTESRFGKPQNRSSHQIYIFSNQESPINTRIPVKQFNNFYNWTMTYRLDSDLIRSYGNIENKTTDYQLPSIESIKKRTKLIAWFVSHCDTSSKRELLYNKLNNYIPIDTYGRCGKFTCPTTNSSGCYSMLEREYKFYLSFENSLCEDYITEKLYSILRQDVVPIVYGGVNYTKMTPPNSVIDVTKFESVEKLAEYLKFLDRNPQEYLKYFEWKKYYVASRTNNVLCHLCKKLNEPIEKKVYENLSEWWDGIYNNKCKTGNNLPKIVQN